MVTIAYIEQIFRRRGRRYQLDDDGDILTYWDGVAIYVVTDQQAGTSLFTHVHTAGNARSANARVGDIETFLDAVNGILRDGAFDYNSELATTFYWTSAHLSGGSQDDRALSEAIERVVALVKAFGSIIASLMEGQISLQQAAAIVRAAFDDGQQGKRSA